jgi:PadR family transcriptional regulator, regulatory protein PadR
MIAAASSGEASLTLYYGGHIRFTYMLSPADREIRLGIWKIHILHHAAAREVWGKWLLDELAEHGHELSPGTLYPALIRMETNGWLERSGEAIHARARQPFRITREGRRLLAQLRREVTELYEEVVLGRDAGYPEQKAPSEVQRNVSTPSKRRAGRRTQPRRRRA